MSKILDPAWRWKHLYFIRSAEGITKIKVRPEQQQLSDLIYPAFRAGEPLDIIILKNRQRGTSTHCNLICLDCTAYFPGKVANTLADTRERAGNMFDNNVRLAWDRIPVGLRPYAERDNVNELIFSKIGSKYMISASKSEPVDLLHTSEAPYFPDDGRITEAEQMVRKNGIKIMESTAYGVANLFERRFMEAWMAFKAGKYHHRIPLFFPWYTDPTNTVQVKAGMLLKNPGFIEQLAARILALDGHVLTPGQCHFYDQKFSDLDDEVYQFYPTEPEEAFLHSGRPVFNQVLLKTMREKLARQPLRVTDDGIEIYEEPDSAKHYGIGGDPAEGLEHGDNSSLSVVCLESGEEVAHVADKISALDEDSLAKLVRVLARMYREHLCMIERNNHGHTVIAYVKEYPEVNLYQVQEEDKITGKTTTKLGWDTNPRSKALLIDTLKRDLKDGECLPHSFETYDELRTFVHGERGTMAAMKGSHDDRVISLALANMACRKLVITGPLDLASHHIY